MSAPDRLPPLWPDSDPAVLAPVPEHEDLRAVARSIVEKHGDLEQLLGAVESGQVPTEVWRRLTAELDLTAIAVPEAQGGAGFGLRELVVVLEETGAALVPDPVLSSAVLGLQALLLADDPAVAADVLADALAGSALVTDAWGHAEALRLEGGTASGRLHRVLDAVGATHLVAPAVGPEGRMLLLVDLAEAGVTPLEHLDVTRRLGDVVLEGASARVLVGPDGVDDALRRLAVLRQVAVAAEHAGMVARLLDMTVAHVTTRQQFGRPIGSFQAVKHRLADVLVARERCRSAVRYAAARLDDDVAAGHDLGGAEVAAAVAAAVGTEAVLAAAHEAVQLHGGIGFTWEHPAHRYLRRALGDEAQFGSARDHRARLAALLAVPGSTPLEVS
ncbi:acyl-CoA dehydrogenase family protein [Nocardioides zeae]|uniref:Alkylation response protein AidB-like acyl-CoA dehydrogenase n=1 Tax=Nocardioides zeae TaxID=1457234 RepID=A0AAJ1X295_9ACTN|nr:acyl-CoA dehydrogenase family protein [Nocardioides zeae]MDQ1105666.1 alkylation response protein AidB-like acyl-CoA dehydrogenase [Nocardioides zeae]